MVSLRPAGRCAGQAAVLSLALVLSGCATEPTVGRADGRFERCDDAEAMRAFERARSLADEGRQAEALVSARQALEACPDFVPAHLIYQDAGLELGGADEAGMRSYYAGLVDDGASPLLPYLLARIGDEMSEQLPLLDLALRRDDTFTYAYVLKAEMYRELNRTAEALGMLQRAVSASPAAADARIGLAEVLQSLGRSVEAAPHYAAYIELEPEDDLARRRYLELLVYGLGRLDEAEALAKDLLERNPRDAVILMDCAAIAWRRGQFDQAVKLYHDVLTVDPSNDRAVLNLGNLYFDAMAGDDEARRREYWPKARAAYRYLIELRRAEGLFDLLDYYVGVHYRLDRITALLGPAPERLPTRADF